MFLDNKQKQKLIQHNLDRSLGSYAGQKKSQFQKFTNCMMLSYNIFEMMTF